MKKQSKTVSKQTVAGPRIKVFPIKLETFFWRPG